MPIQYDIDANRKSRTYSGFDLVRRALWGICTPAFRFSPRIAFGWRRFLLRCFGARIGREVHIYSSATVYMPWNLEVGDWSAIGEHVLVYNLGSVRIGARSTISHGAHICAGTHDYRQPAFPLVKSPVSIGDEVWICADAFLGPGIEIGEGAIAGARAVVVENVPPWTIVAGNPAKVIKRRSAT